MEAYASRSSQLNPSFTMNDPTNNIHESNQEGLTEVGSTFENLCSIDGLNCKYYTETEFASELATHKGLSFMHLNIASLSKHFDSLNHLLDTLKGMNIVGVSETRINKDNIKSSNFKIKGYNLLCHATEAAAGGTALYISEKLTFKPREDLSIAAYIPKLLESTFIEIESKKKANIVVGCFYKHPVMSTREFNKDIMTNILNKINTEGKRLVLLGDFNINLLEYKVNNEVKNFVDILQSNLIAPTINLPTRISAQSSTLIDNIFISLFNSEIYAGNLLVGISDHMPQVVIISNEFEKSNNSISNLSQIDWSKFDITKFKNEFMSLNWDEIISIEQNDPDFSFERFHKKVLELVDNNVPKRRLTKKQLKRQHKPWITKEIRKTISVRDVLFRKFVKEINPVLRDNLFCQYKACRNQVVSTIRHSKKQYYNNFFKENIRNHKKIWEGINELTNLKSKNNSTNISIKIGDRIVSDPKTVANEFNEYFSNIADKVRAKIPETKASYKDFLTKRCRNSFFFRPTEKEEILKIINSIDQTKSTGPNSIPNKILNCVTEKIALILSKIFNISIRKGKYIEDLKLVKVVPIFKNKGSPFEAGNFRPISLLSNIDKIFEKLVHKRMINFLEAKKILYKNQFGFRHKSSTTDSLICLTENIRVALDSGKLACGIFIDLQKAFDTVDHEILLDKLQYCGFRGICNSWLRSYLTGRKQFVHVGGKNSSAREVKHGVPQGSVLGPLLFLIYINDLPNSLRFCLPHIFADDTALLYIERSPKALQKRINIDMKLLLKWLNANKISLNIAKTEIILFKHKLKTIKFRFKIKLDGKRLIFKDYVNYLGVLIDKHLNWSHHQEKVATKLRQANGVLSRIRHYLPMDLRKNIYFALFHSKLTYAIQIWGQSLNMNSRITKLQKSAVRLISFSNFRAASMPIFKTFNIHPTPNVVFNLNIKLAHKILNSECPGAIQEILGLQYSQNRFSTRSACLKLFVRPYVRTETFGNKSIKNQTIIQWNKLQIRNKNVDLAICSPSMITKLINKFLLEHNHT